MAAVADPLLRLLYGEKYLLAIPVLQLLAMFGTFAALLNPSEQILIATENQGFFIRWNIAMIVVFVAAGFALVPGSAKSRPW